MIDDDVAERLHEPQAVPFAVAPLDAGLERLMRPIAMLISLPTGISQLVEKPHPSAERLVTTISRGSLPAFHKLARTCTR
jgi:hypothetical protein